MGPILSVVRRNSAPAFKSGTDSVFVKICCDKKFIGFQTPQQHRTTDAFGNDV